MEKRKIILWLVSVIIVIILLVVIRNNYTKPAKPLLKTPSPALSPSPTPIEPIQFTQEQLQGYYKSYQDPYVIHIRKALNGYLSGTNYGMDDPKSTINGDPSFNKDGLLTGLKNFSNDYYKSKFIVYSINSSIAGGYFIRIEFQDKPDKIFLAWVYKLGTGAYDLREFAQDLSFTPDQIKVNNIEYQDFLNDKVHAL